MSKALTRISCAALLLATLGLPAFAGAAEGPRTPAHEEVTSAPVRATRNGTARLEFSAFSRDFRLQLANNPRLALVAAGSSLQLYTGNLDGIPGSWARISVRDGLPRGMIWDGSELFIVDAAPEGVNSGAAGTVMYKLSDAVLERGVSFHRRYRGSAARRGGRLWRHGRRTARACAGTAGRRGHEESRDFRARR
jgi:hypothetical protein